MLQQVDELTGQDDTFVRMVPAREGLHTGYGPALKINNWLVAEGEFAVVQGSPQFGPKRRPMEGVVVAIPVMQAVAGAARPLGSVHRHVGQAKKAVHAGTVDRKDGRTEARANRQFSLLHGKWRVEHRNNLNGVALGIAEIFDGDREGEFISPESGYHVGARDLVLQSSRYLSQHTVSALMTERIVYVFEIVEVKDVEGKGGLISRRGEFPEAFTKVRPVRETCGRVVKGLEPESLLPNAVLGDVPGDVLIAGCLPALKYSAHPGFQNDLHPVLARQPQLTRVRVASTIGAGGHVSCQLREQPAKKLFFGISGHSFDGRICVDETSLPIEGEDEVMGVLTRVR